MQSFRLRDVEPGDADAYLRMRCDPAMMSELGGPQLPEDVLLKVSGDVAAARSGESWILMIELDGGQVAGTVVVWAHEVNGTHLSEIGWMVLPEYQGQGLASAAVRETLARAGVERRWGTVHAFTAFTNVASNALCRSVGFTLQGQQEIEFMASPGALFIANHWTVTP